MNLRSSLLNNLSFVFENNIFYQKELKRSQPFEARYTSLRKKENRVYPDDLVRNLPEIENSHPLVREWIVRKNTSTLLINYLKTKEYNSILELGCGNGWLTNRMAMALRSDICGADINEKELLQGGRLFGSHPRVSFIYGDIFTLPLPENMFNAIVLASSIQYFPDLEPLINKLFKIMTPSGEIHVIDSPLYDSVVQKTAAQNRSKNYFNSLGNGEMTENYFHHSVHDLHNFNYQILFNPKSLRSIFTRIFLNRSQTVFPWIVIKRN